MSTLLEKVEAIEKAGAGDLAEQALQKLMHLQVQKYTKELEAVRRELEPFEQQYSMSSEECHRQFSKGELGDTAEIMEWMGLYDNALLYQERIAALRAAAGL
jgi:hypothetical protein